MATADLITQLKQDFDDVYEAGKTAGGGSGDYEQGYEDGKNSVVDYLQYVTLLNGVRRDLISEKDITLNLLNATTINNLFNTSSATVDATNYNVEHITVTVNEGAGEGEYKVDKLDGVYIPEKSRTVTVKPVWNQIN